MSRCGDLLWGAQAASPPFRQLAENVFRRFKTRKFATLSVSSAGLPTTARWERALPRSPLADVVEVRSRFALNHPDVTNF
jgi:hypothetical protein